MAFTYKLKETLNSKLKWLQNHNELCDVLLVSGQCRVAAHSCVLASYSPVLAAVLKARLAIQNDWSIHKPLIIALDDKANQSISKDQIEHQYSCIEMIISFLYGEEITVGENKINELISLSKVLGLAQHFLKCPKSPVYKDEDELKEKETDNRDHDVIITVEERSVNPVESCQTSNALKHKRRQNGSSNCMKNHENNYLMMRAKSKIHSFNKNKILKTNSKDLFNTIKSKHMYIHKTLRDQKQDIHRDEERKLYILKDKNRLNINSKKNQSERRKRKTKPFACSVCKSSFSRANHLISHAKKENHYSQVCPLCFTQLDEYDDRKKHFSQHDHPSPFFCLCCDLRFRSRAGLAMHAPKHSDTKPYTCKECGRRFKWRHSAQAHSVTHRNHCHLLCDVCGFSSKYTSTFQSHLKRHYDQFFPCPHPGCNFKSFRKTHLNDHYATHAKLRPHQCEICGHSFSQAKNMRRHMRLHTPDTNFLKCSVFSNQDCPYKTTRPDKLRIHLLQKHKMEHHDKISLPVAEGTSSGNYQLELKEDSVFHSYEFEDKDNAEIVSDLGQSAAFANRDFLLDNPCLSERQNSLDLEQTYVIPESISNKLVSDKLELHYVDTFESLVKENIEILNDLSANESEIATLELEISPVEADGMELIAKSGKGDIMSKNLTDALPANKRLLLSKISKQICDSETDFVVHSTI